MLLTMDRYIPVISQGGCICSRGPFCAYNGGHFGCPVNVSHTEQVQIVAAFWPAVISNSARASRRVMLRIDCDGGAWSLCV